jgi:hypothetical protein
LSESVNYTYVLDTEGKAYFTDTDLFESDGDDSNTRFVDLSQVMDPAEHLSQGCVVHLVARTSEVKVTKKVEFSETVKVDYVDKYIEQMEADMCFTTENDAVIEISSGNSSDSSMAEHTTSLTESQDLKQEP